RPVADHVDRLAAVDDGEVPAFIRSDGDGEIALADPHNLDRFREDRVAELAVDQRGARFAGQLDDRTKRGEVDQQLFVRRSALEAFGIFLGNEAGGELPGAEARVLQ